MDQHSAISAALAAAGKTFEPGPSPENRLHDAFEPQLEVRLEGHVLASKTITDAGGIRMSDLPGWDPQPGAIDIRVLRDGTLRVAFELKVNEIGQSLWDMLKMAAVARISGVEATYVVVAAQTSVWRLGNRSGIPYFPSTPGEPQVASIADLFHEYKREWPSHLRHDTGRVVDFPESLELTSLGAFPVSSTPAYEIRALAVRDAPGCSYRRQDDGWPGGLKPPADER